LELDPADYPDLLRPIQQGRADVVFGSRLLNAHPPMRFVQYWGNRTMNLLFNIMYGTRLTDVETCYQVFRREVIQHIDVKSDHWAFTVELTVKILRSGYDIVEVPVRYEPRRHQDGKKISWADGLITFFAAVQYRFWRPAAANRSARRHVADQETP